MKLSDLIPYINETVTIYIVDSDDLGTVYCGLLKSVPSDILKRRVSVISTQKNIIDIGVKDD